MVTIFNASVLMFDLARIYHFRRPQRLYASIKKFSKVSDAPTNQATPSYHQPRPDQPDQHHTGDSGDVQKEHFHGSFHLSEQHCPPC